MCRQSETSSTRRQSDNKHQDDQSVNQSGAGCLRQGSISGRPRGSKRLRSRVRKEGPQTASRDECSCPAALHRADRGNPQTEGLIRRVKVEGQGTGREAAEPRVPGPWGRHPVGLPRRSYPRKDPASVHSLRLCLCFLPAGTSRVHPSSLTQKAERRPGNRQAKGFKSN